MSYLHSGCCWLSCYTKGNTTYLHDIHHPSFCSVDKSFQNINNMKKKNFFFFGDEYAEMILVWAEELLAWCYCARGGFFEAVAPHKYERLDRLSTYINRSMCAYCKKKKLVGRTKIPKKRHPSVVWGALKWSLPHKNVSHSGLCRIASTSPSYMLT